MVDLEQHIDDVLTKYNPQRIILACSGGLDSTVLLHACLKMETPVEIAHVNYQLRGKESEGDQQFLEQLATEKSIPIHVKKIDLQSQLKDGGNLQELAREQRYAFFDSLQRTTPNTIVLLAHHKEDQTETFFMNLARNSGVMGLAGMPEKRGCYLRPLLAFSKYDLRTYAEEKSISWREDSSNESLKYTRNEWRNLVLPEIRKSVPELDESVQILTRVFQEKQSELQEKIKTIVDDILEKKTLSATTFQSLDSFEVIELCRQLGQPIGIAETWTKLNHKGTGVKLTPNENSPFYKVVFEGDSYSFLSETTIPKLEPKIEQVEVLPERFDKSTLYLDRHLISGELQFRPVQTGDRIHPIGMEGSRLVSDVISDAKLTSIEKQQLQVLVDDRHVLWVPELCVSRKAIASAKSTEILKIEL